jgi:hypothetical protein
LLLLTHSTMRTETGEVINSGEVTCGLSTGDVEGGNLRNNYSRPEGQNVGNFISDRPTSRVLAAPGGASSIVFGTEDAAPAAQAPRTGRAPGALAPSSDHQTSSNNYARPDGQNCGNFLTDRKVRGHSACSSLDTCVLHSMARAACMQAGQRHGGECCSRLQTHTHPSFLPHSMLLFGCCDVLQAVKVHAPPGGASQIHFG